MAKKPTPQRPPSMDERIKNLLKEKAHELTYLIKKYQISEQTVPSTLIQELENLQFLSNRINQPA